MKQHSLLIFFYFVTGQVLDVACNQDGSNLAFIKKANNHIVTASVGSQIYENTTTLNEVKIFS